MTNVIMPKLGLTMEEGTIVQWHVKEGDTVAEGAALCDIETDKLTNTVEAKLAGVVGKILVGEGETVPVQTVITVIN